MNNFTQTEFNLVKEEAENYYKTIGEIYCPYFSERISFGSQGLEHLKFKQRGKVRNEQDQYMRLKLIKLAPEVLSSSNTLQGIFETKKFERVRIHSRTDIILKPVTYYEFIAVIKRNRVKIIVKQIDSGQKFFWSIIPFWGMNVDTKTRLFHEGNPEEN